MGGVDAGVTSAGLLPRRRMTWLLAALPVAFLGYLFIYPLIRILFTGLEGGAGSAFAELVSRRSLIGVAWFTLWQAVVSTVLTIILALPITWVLSRFTFPGRSVVRAALLVPFVLPTIVMGAAFLALAGPSGLLGVDLTGTVWIILWAHIAFNIAVVARTLGGLWEHLDPRLEEAARLLGASRWQAFRTVTLPLLRPALGAAASIVFLFCFTSFGVVLILGGTEFATIEVEIWRQVVGFLDLPVAAALAIVQLVGVTAALLAYSRYQQRHAREQPLRPVSETLRKPATLVERSVVVATVGLTLLLIGGPPAVLVARSFSSGFDAYLGLGEQLPGFPADPLTAVGNSLSFAAVAAVIALLVGLLSAAVVAYGRGAPSRWFDTVLMLPLGTSAVTIGFGFLIALDSPIDLRTSWILVPLAHALVAIPLVVRVAVPVMRSVEVRLREAARVLGASPLRAWGHVDLPMVARAGLVGAAFAFVVSLGEFGATQFIVRPDTPTVPTTIYRLLSRPGELTFSRAMALSVVLMVMTVAVALSIERARPGGLGSF